MSVTVRANKLTISHRGSTGYEMNSTPDLCRSPTVPVPYKIISFSRDIVRGTTTVFADGGNSIDVRGSAHTPCYGDEPGTGLGVISNTVKHESTWITYSPNVYIQGRNVCRHSDKMFMNNKNCISASGNIEPFLHISDPVLRELCKIFCKVRDDWHACKEKGGACKKPSVAAKEATEKALAKNGDLARAVEQKFGKGFVGQAEKAFLSASSKAFEGARAFYTESAMRAAMKRQLDNFLKREAVSQATKLAGRAWTQFVPILNVLVDIYTVGDLAYSGYEIYKMIKESNLAIDNAIKVKPDVGIQDADGKLAHTYDYKFDDPKSGYSDDWNAKQKQEQAYREAAGGKSPQKVDNNTCRCPPRGGGPVS